jgi:uncharacterized protein YlbG (UPF0298 family)
MFERTGRQGLVVYLYYNRDARKVSKYGDVHYHSRRLRYLLLYLNQEEVEETMAELSQQKFVKEVKPSYFDEIDTDFVGSLYREESLEKVN